ncbi:MAG: hypothetical protein MJE66_15785, partial [Proteobacteria bacterium]|nr:hypothetical protein [Pseudomonadota bacterium]
EAAAGSEEFVARPIPTSGEEQPTDWMGEGALRARSRAGDSIGRIRTEAYAEGVAAGRAEIPWENVQQLRSAATALADAAYRVGQLQRNYLREQRHALIDLAAAMAERIVRRELTLDREALSAAVGRTLEALPEGGAVEVSLAPSDLETVQRGEGSEWMPDWGRHATFRADETLQPGDMRAVATQTRVDARVVDLVARLCEELEDVIEAPQEESP